MIEQLLGRPEFYGMVTAIALATGRGIKRFWPSFPPLMLPWLVIGVAYGVCLGDAVGGGLPLALAFGHAVAGLVSGAVAVGFHETAKGILVPMVGEDAARRLIGKIGGDK